MNEKNKVLYLVVLYLPNAKGLLLHMHLGVHECGSQFNSRRHALHAEFPDNFLANLLLKKVFLLAERKAFEIFWHLEQIILTQWFDLLYKASSCACMYSCASTVATTIVQNVEAPLHLLMLTLWPLSS